MIGAPELTAIGAGIGLLYGTFGAGASAFATPVLALAGVPALLAVASPLPATLPAALLGAWSHRRHGEVAGRLAQQGIAVGLPAALAGALSSSSVPGTTLLVLSALVLLLAGLRLAWVAGSAATPHVRSRRTTLVAIAGVGFAAGLLANSGGFLLIPVLVLVAGLGVRQAAATSMVVAAVLTIPTLATHWWLGHVDWRVAALFAVGLLPGTLAGTALGRHVPAEGVQRAFGGLLVAFGAWYLLQVS
ncbi:MAG: hypothetical protein JWN67_2623 [Actinomycetia bacterium]|nr:hypothetical protein [Actinomycetes bacterium]